jgi:hypothetical protein
VEAFRRDRPGGKTRRSSVRYSVSDERPDVDARVFEISTTLTQLSCRFDDHCALPEPDAVPALEAGGRVVPVEALPVEPVELVPAVVPVLDVLPEPEVVDVEPVLPMPLGLPLELEPEPELGAALQTMLTRSPELTLFRRAAALLDTERTTGAAGALDEALPGVAGCRTVTVMPDGSTETTSAVTRWPLLWLDVAGGRLCPLVAPVLV